MTHVPEHELISAYLDGELSDAEREQVEKLLKRSPEARRQLGEFRALSSTLGSLSRHELGEDLSEAVLGAAEREVLVGGDSVPTPAPPRTALGPTLFRRFLTPRAILWSSLAVGVAVMLMLNESAQQDKRLEDGIALAPKEAAKPAEPPSLRAAPAMEKAKQAEARAERRDLAADDLEATPAEDKGFAGEVLAGKGASGIGNAAEMPDVQPAREAQSRVAATDRVQQPPESTAALPQSAQSFGGGPEVGGRKLAGRGGAAGLAPPGPAMSAAPAEGVDRLAESMEKEQELRKSRTPGEPAALPRVAASAPSAQTAADAPAAAPEPAMDVGAERVPEEEVDGKLARQGKPKPMAPAGPDGAAFARDEDTTANPLRRSPGALRQETTDELLVVHCDVLPEVARNFSQLLADQGIALPKHDKQLKRHRDVYAEVEQKSERPGEQRVYAEATPSQIEATLTELQARREQVARLDVQPAARVQRQQALTRFNRSADFSEQNRPTTPAKPADLADRRAGADRGDSDRKGGDRAVEGGWSKPLAKQPYPSSGPAESFAAEAAQPAQPSGELAEKYRVLFVLRVIDPAAAAADALIDPAVKAASEK